MRIAFDTNVLAWMLSDAAAPPIDKSTGKPVTEGGARLKLLKDRITSGEIEPIIIPTPVLAEVFSVEPDALGKYLPILSDPLVFTLAPFGLAASVELSIVNNEYLATGDKRGGLQHSWQKIKTDRQIFAIAKVAGADAIYTDDDGLSKLCEQRGMRVVHSWEIPLPDTGTQNDMLDDLDI